MSGHSAHLTVAAFAQGQLDPRIWNGFTHTDRRGAWPEPERFLDATSFCGLCHAVFEHNSLGQSIEGCVIGCAFDLNEVGFGFFELWIGELCLQLAIICEEQKTFAVTIKSTRRIDIFFTNKV